MTTVLVDYTVTSLAGTMKGHMNIPADSNPVTAVLLSKGLSPVPSRRLWRFVVVSPRQKGAE